MSLPFQRFTRRDLLRGGALTAGAAGAVWLGFPLTAGPARASSSLRRCVTLGADGVINPGGAQDYRANRDLLLDTGTKWVRLWADWPALQPEASAPPDRGSGAWKLRELDAQIAQANADGIQVILCSYRFPTWANGTAALSASEEAVQELPDRALTTGGTRKELCFKIPSDLTPGGAWGRWIRFLVARYGRRSPSRKAVVSFLEVCNEPNLQFWPQQGPGPAADPYAPGPLTVHVDVARMFETARSITAQYGDEPLLCGPATSDGTGDTRLTTGYDTFTEALLTELERRGFDPGRTFAWAHHNYTDVESDSSTRLAKVRSLLAGRWAGWPDGTAQAPGILIAEGGARLAKADTLARHAELVQRNYDRLARDPGVAMVGQYLFDTDPNFDSGLREADGTPRPAYDAWAALPSGG
jgi:hypothetical protein